MATVLAIALTALLVVAALVWVFRVGRDRRYAGSFVDRVFGTGDHGDELVPLAADDETPVEFEPPEDLRPAEIGVLAHFRARPRDITATIVDLAVRGYVRIDAAPGVEPGVEPDGSEWTVTRVEGASPSGGALRPYERQLLEALFAQGKRVPRDRMRLILGARMPRLRRSVVDDAMAAGWFVGRPDDRRRRFTELGVFLIMAGLAVFGVLRETNEDLAPLGIPLVAAGIIVRLGGLFAPRRTARGYALLRRAEGFRRFIVESEGARASAAARAGVFSEYLGYAIVFGATARWAQAYRAIDGAAPDTSIWFGSLGPLDGVGVVRALDGFVTGATADLSSPRRR
jgi:hypothetical protein